MTEFQFPYPHNEHNHHLPRVIQVSSINTGKMLRTVCLAQSSENTGNKSPSSIRAIWGVDSARQPIRRTEFEKGSCAPAAHSVALERPLPSGCFHHCSRDGIRLVSTHQATLWGSKGVGGGNGNPPFPVLPTASQHQMVFE